MQKISSYLYPNRIQLLADLAGFTTEYTNVYQRHLKIYNGIDNTIEFDIKNADQKRIDLTTVSQIEMNVMDAQGTALANSPYTVTPLTTTIASAAGATIIATTSKATTTTITIPTANITGSFQVPSSLTVSTGIIGAVHLSRVDSDIDSATTTLTVTFQSQTVTGHTGVSVLSTTDPVKGIATVTIPQEDLLDLDAQFLKYSVSCVKDGKDTLLYADSRFGAVGTIELVGNAMPTFRDPVEYKTYHGEIDLVGNVINHFSAMPVTFYEAEKTTSVDITVYLTGFIGNVWLEGATSDTISVESFRGKEIPNTRHVFTDPYTGTYSFPTSDVGEYKYIRVGFQGDNPLNPTGKVDKVIIE